MHHILYRNYASVVIDSQSRTFKAISIIDNPYRAFDLSGFYITQAQLFDAPGFGVLIGVSDGTVVRVWDIVRA